MWLFGLHTLEPQENLVAEARRLGVDPARIFFTRGFGEDVHLEIKSVADLFLDTPSYNAHSTVNPPPPSDGRPPQGTDALWAGVPILTRPLDKMSSRCGGGVYLP
jgi:protein O-GlcNAc transferase